MDIPRIAILDQNDTIVGFLDNDQPNSLPFWDDELHEYLEGTSNTFTFKSDAKHPDSLHLIEGYKIAFRTDRRDYYLNIMIVHRDEDEVEVEAWSTNLELLNEQVAGLDPEEAHSFVWYKNHFDPENTVKIGLNEIGDKQIKNKWDGESTVLSRLYSLANVFDAELEFVPQLNQDYSLNKIVMNVYRAHSDSAQGVGKALTMNLVYGREIKGIKKTSDITDLYTCIYPHGSTIEGSDAKVDIAGISHTVKDEDGRTEFYTDGALIRAPLARDRFPSSMSQSNDRYILVHWDCDVADKEVLYGRALAELKKNCTPKVTYEIDGYADTGIGDTVRITDEEYNPILYLEARVTEQIRSFTDPSRNKTTYSNIDVLRNEIDSSLLARVEALIQANKVYIGEIITDNGVQFVNGSGHTTLTARVLDGVINVVNRFSIKWFKDGTEISGEQSILVNAGDFEEKAVYRFEAYQDTRVVAQSEATLTNVIDGQNGLPSYLHVRYSNDGGKTFTGNNGKTEGKWMGTYTDHLEADSEKVSDYTWARIRGEDGQSLVDMHRQFYLSTSDTAQIGGTWLDSYPSVFDGRKFLWVRWKATYENPSSIAFSTPELDLTWTQVQAGLDKAQQAIDSANSAKDSAQEALDTANTVKGEADQIKKDLEPIQQGVDDAKKLAQDAKNDVAKETQEVLTQIEGSYATKNEVTELESSLKAQIIADATQIATNVSETVTQNNQSKIDSFLLGFNESLASKMETLDRLTSNNGQANKKLLEAKNTLADLEKDLADLKKDPNATQAQINTLQNAVNAAKNEVSSAQREVDGIIAQIEAMRAEIESIAKDGVQKLTSRVTTNETKIEENAQAIYLKANTTDVNKSLAGLRTDLEGKITVESGRITKVVSQINTLGENLDGAKENLQGMISSAEERLSAFATQTATGIEQEVAQRVTEIQGNMQIISEATSILSQKYNGFEMSFNDFRTVVEADNRLTGQQLTTIQKFIRFIDGNILLGEEGNAQMLKIAKDRISFLQGGNEVAYISNNTLYIHDGVFLNSLRIQNYVWLPRANGHLSLKKVR